MSKCTTVTIEEVRQMGAHDALEAYRESNSTETPDGGWDSWLINGCGVDYTIRLFGEDPAENEGGWSESMSAKLIAYHQAAVEALSELE